MREKYLEEYREVGKRIAFYRKKRGVSQETLGEKLNVSREYVGIIEGDYFDRIQLNHCPWSLRSLDLLFAIADALEVDLPIFFLPLSDEHFEEFRTDGEGHKL